MLLRMMHLCAPLEAASVDVTLGVCLWKHRACGPRLDGTNVWFVRINSLSFCLWWRHLLGGVRRLAASTGEALTICWPPDPEVLFSKAVHGWCQN